MISAFRWGGWSSRPGRFTPRGKIRYPQYRRLGGPEGRSGRVRKISPPPPWFDPRTAQPVASHYTDWAIRDTRFSEYRPVTVVKLCQLVFTNIVLHLRPQLTDRTNQMHTSPVDDQAEGRERRIGVPLLYVHIGSDVTTMHSVKYWSSTSNVHHAECLLDYIRYTIRYKSTQPQVNGALNLKTHNSTFPGTGR